MSRFLALAAVLMTTTSAAAQSGALPPLGPEDPDAPVVVARHFGVLPVGTTRLAYNKKLDPDGPIEALRIVSRDENGLTTVHVYWDAELDGKVALRRLYDADGNLLADGEPFDLLGVTLYADTSYTPHDCSNVLGVCHFDIAWGEARRLSARKPPRIAHRIQQRLSAGRISTMFGACFETRCTDEISQVLDLSPDGLPTALWDDFLWSGEDLDLNATYEWSIP